LFLPILLSGALENLSHPERLSIHDPWSTLLSPRVKSSLIILAILLALLPALILLSNQVILKGFLTLETEDAKQRILRATAAIQTDLAQLDSITADWAARDSSYDFLEGENEGYLESNLFPERTTNLGIHLVVMLDSKNRVAVTRSFEPVHGLAVQSAEDITRVLADNGILDRLDHKAKTTIKGIITINGVPMLLSARPVTPNNPKVLSNGYLIFGRLLDQREIARLANVNDLLLDLRPLAAADLPQDYRAASVELQRVNIVTRPLDEKTFAAYTLLSDVAGQSHFILREQSLRSVYQNGRLTLLFFQIALSLISLVFGLFGQAALERQMVSQRSSIENLGRYRSVVDQISEGLVLLDGRTKIIREANPAFAALLGFESSQLTGVCLYDLTAQSLAEVDADFSGLLDSGARMIGERRYRRRDGSLIDVEVSASRMVYGGRDVLVVVLRDITARKNAEKALRASEQRYHLATEGANDGLWDWNLASNEIYFSSRWKSMLGYADHQIDGDPQAWFSLVHPEDLEALQAQLNAHLEGGTGHFQSEHRMRHKNGEYRWMLSRGMAVWGEEHAPIRIAGSQTDITERKQVEDQFRHDAFHDALTGLPNRSLFLDRLGQAVERSKRRSDFLFAMLFLDFDRFKVINDSLGHTTGDQLLIEGARRMEGCLRTMDTIARLGGDEFVILLEYIESAQDAIRVAERIQETLKPAFHIDGHDIFISASTGIVLSTIGYDRAEDVLRDADIAMYRSKALGRARYELFNTNLRSMAMARLEMETQLRHSLEHSEFTLYYQPIISIKDNRIVGFESLLRWLHPSMGSVAPDDFVPVAEETGLIVPIGEWVLRESCRQMRAWQEKFPALRPLTINVNMSARQFTQPDLPEAIHKILQETGLDISCLRLEITESVVLEALESTTNLLNRLKNMGVQLEIDDFGTGYSSLSYLQQLPINAIKIDRSFICKMTQDGSNYGIVQAIIAMVHNLGLQVIAEGVEVPEQLSLLKSLGCESAQGFLFYRPMDCDGVEELLATIQK
jgi:diguanylate cyclase (GGDEF)-like protein/PAS domain S-box-containing protein